MAKSLNKAQVIGNAGKDAEVRYTGTGKAVASFSVATTDSWKDKASGQLQERTEWHNIVAWDRLAEICGEYVKKGTKVYIEGRIQNRSYDDKDGNKRYISEIVANDLLLLSGRPEGGGGGGYDQGSAPAYGGGSNNGGGFNTNRGGGSNNNSSYGGGSNYGGGGASTPMVPDFEPAGSDDDLPF